MSERTAIITGVTGQDGSFLAELLLENDYEVHGIARRVSVNTNERIAHLLDEPQFVLHEGDVTDAFSMLRLIQEIQPTEIYNLAAQSHVQTSFSQPVATWEATAGGCLNLLEAVRLVCPAARFYQASSSEMFGNAYSVLLDGTKYQDENTLFAPCSPYAVAKLAAHQLVDVYRKSYGIHASAGILFNHESFRRGENFVTRKITKYLGELSCNRLPSELGNRHRVSYHMERRLQLGNVHAQRDWGHADDYVRAMYLMLQADEPDDYVIATGETHSVADFLAYAFGVLDIGNWQDYVQCNISQHERPNDVQYLRGNSTKARSKLGWEPQISFETLVEGMVHYDIQAAQGNI